MKSHIYTTDWFKDGTLTRFWISYTPRAAKKVIKQTQTYRSKRTGELTYKNVPSDGEIKKRLKNGTRKANT